MPFVTVLQGKKQTVYYKVFDREYKKFIGYTIGIIDKQKDEKGYISRVRLFITWRSTDDYKAFGRDVVGFFLVIFKKFYVITYHLFLKRKKTYTPPSKLLEEETKVGVNEDEKRILDAINEVKGSIAHLEAKIQTFRDEKGTLEKELEIAEARGEDTRKIKKQIDNINKQGMEIKEKIEKRKEELKELENLFKETKRKRIEKEELLEESEMIGIPVEVPKINRILVYKFLKDRGFDHIPSIFLYI
jgi:hypothetical protein